MQTPRPTPRPMPKFYSCREGPFSTKRARKTQARRPDAASNGIGTGGYMTAPKTPLCKTLPAVSRVAAVGLTSASSAGSNGRYPTSKCHLISFKQDYSNNNSCEEHMLHTLHYDDSSNESFFDQCFIIESKLGEGSFGEVFQVRSREDGGRYAVKRAMAKFRNAKDHALKLDEVMKHETLPKHRHLVNFVRAWEERDRLYIQTELCQFSLSDFAERNHQIPEKLIWKYLVDLLLALKHLHDHDLVHMDIKPENIFVGPGNVCKLGDFGLVFDLINGSVSDIQEGDSKYLAPELLRPELGAVGTRADMFSLGLSMLELACDLDLSLRGEGWHLLRQGVLPTEFMQHLSPELRRVLAWMLAPRVADRPSADQLLHHARVRTAYRWRQTELVCFNFRRWCYEAFVSLLLLFMAVLHALTSPFIHVISSLCLNGGDGNAGSADRSANGSRRKVTPAHHDRAGQQYHRVASPSPAAAALRTPVERVAKPLRFDDSFSDLDFDDEDECNVSSIRNSPAGSQNSSFRQQPRAPAADLVHEDTSSSSSTEEAEQLLTASGRKMKTKRRPINSTPAQKRQTTRLLPSPNVALTQPNRLKKRKLANLSLSPSMAAGGDDGAATSMCDDCHSPYGARRLRPASAFAPGGSGDSPAAYLPPKNLRLIFEARGSSSDEM